MKAYPIILSLSEVGYIVSVPDLGVDTQGNDIAEAIYMARDAIGAWAIFEQDMGRIVPEPSTALPKAAKGEIAMYVDIDFDSYRKNLDTTAERTNVSLPRNLKRKAEAAGLSFSQTLQEALKEKLHLTTSK
ncbi:MAG: type II toxin-antitoxin system HicB family antitoxin [Dehalococcoidia bacterium]|nr:type II toxin-antitoxin system HicB family antitoxin [Dehalococcoidia bacterium]